LVVEQTPYFAENEVTFAQGVLKDMNPIIRALGKVLRLVGISSPEDNVPRRKEAADAPSWRDKGASPKATQVSPKDDDRPR
jgi:hypothetical protein